MKLLKIYDKDYTPITTLTETEFNRLSYKRTLQEIGECQFLVRLNDAKITDESLTQYNRVEIVEDNVVKFIGVIVRRTINLDTATIRCRELTYVLKKRILGSAYVVNGDIDVKVAAILTAVNSADDTGITAGDLTGAVGNVNTTFNQANAFEIIKQITKATGNQFILESDRSIKVSPNIGTDLSASVIFTYDINLVSASNLLRFEVEEDGDDIVTKAHGKSDAYTSTQTDSALVTKYGVLEKYKDFRVINSSGVLDDFTEAEIKDKVFSPDLSLNPGIEDNFEIGDTIRVVIKNALVDIDDNFQILEKSVQYDGDQKKISVKINDLPVDLAEKLNERDVRLELLEKEV